VGYVVPGLVDDISYLHYTAKEGMKEYVINRVSADSTLLLPYDGKSLLLTASLPFPKYPLVCELLRLGPSPNQRVEVIRQYGSSPSTAPFSISIWAAILSTYIDRKMASYFDPYMEESKHETFLIVKEFLKAGAPSDVYFLLKHQKDRAAGDLMLLTLEDFILLEQPLNADTLVARILKSKSISWPWNGTGPTISNFLAGITRSSILPPEYKRISRNELQVRSGCYRFHGISVEGEFVQSGFLLAHY
jgi:hypothetical protein